MSTTYLRYHIKAPREKIYAALLSPQDIVKWKVPNGMTAEVHTFEPREGGAFRVSLTYSDGGMRGKTTAATDTYHGHFVKLVPNERIVESMEFETDKPEMHGRMTISYSLETSGSGTDVIAMHEHLPPGVSPADNEAGWLMAMAKLAALVEAK